MASRRRGLIVGESVSGGPVDELMNIRFLIQERFQLMRDLGACFDPREFGGTADAVVGVGGGRGEGTVIGDGGVDSSK